MNYQSSNRVSLGSYPGDERFESLLAEARAGVSVNDCRLMVYQLMETGSGPDQAADYVLSRIGAGKCRDEVATDLVRAMLGLWNELAVARNAQSSHLYPN